MKKHCFLWLALRLMKKQKLRTVTLFFGSLSVSFLLHAFCGTGYYFWQQVHGGTPDASYGFGQNILAALAVLLAAVVFSCSAVIMHSLFSLTSGQKRQSLHRFRMLGASGTDVIIMAAAEAVMLYGTAVPAGGALAVFAAARMGIRLDIPFWICGWIGLWMLGLFGGCAVLLVLSVYLCSAGRCHVPQEVYRPQIRQKSFGRQDAADSPQDVSRKGSRSGRRNQRYAGSISRGYFFAFFMAEKYHKADRKRQAGITFIMIAAMLLYVPAGYLIHTNIQINQKGLHEKYGIEYSCVPEDRQELQKSIEECRNLKKAVSEASVSYVELPGTISAASSLLSMELLTVLDKAGWTGSEQFEEECSIYFLEDNCYNEYIRSVLPEMCNDKSNKPDTAFPILVNRFINRTVFSKDAQIYPQEAPLLRAEVQRALNEGSGCAADIKIRCGIYMDEPDTWTDIKQPYACTDLFPDGIDAGKAAVIIPLSRMPDVCADVRKADKTFLQGIYVRSLFVDTDETIFETLQESLGVHAAGKLKNIRKDYQEWYESLREIHLALLCICGVLFGTAVFQVFSILLFHCMQRRQGLAILWSIGQTKKKLAVILVLESIRSFVRALLAGIPASCILCYGIYRIYRSVWNTAFKLPFEQLLSVTAVMAAASAAAACVSCDQIRRQDFLKEVRRML